MELTFEIPDTLLSIYKNKQFLTEVFKLNNALMLYKKGDISISKALELTGLDIYDFIKECKKNDIPVIDLSKEELMREVNAAYSG